MKLRAPGPKPILIAAVRPNLGVEAAYRRKLALMVKRVCHTHSLGERSSDALLTRDIHEPDAARKGPVPATLQPPQQRLFA